MFNPSILLPVFAALRSARQAADHAVCRASFGLGIAGTLAAVSPVSALQVVEARDGVAIEAVVSIKEPTRIRIEGAAITDVIGNLHSSTCAAPAPTASGTANATAPMAPAINPAGEFVLECDRDKGEVYVRPVGLSPKPLNLFIASAWATYTLVLRKADTPADTIVIRDRHAQAGPSPAGQSLIGRGGTDEMSASSHGSRLGNPPSHLRAMKALLVAMASDRVPPDLRLEEVYQPMALWAETRFALTRRVEGRGLVGERFLLQNLSAEALELDEASFDRPDSPQGGQILGIAVERHHLRPGESTVVFVIRRGGQ